MQSLGDLWMRINPDCVIGADDTAALNIKIRTEQAEKVCIAPVKKAMVIQIATVRANGTLAKLLLGLKLFCKRYDIITEAKFTQMNIGHRK